MIEPIKFPNENYRPGNFELAFKINEIIAALNYLTRRDGLPEDVAFTLGQPSPYSQTEKPGVLFGDAKTVLDNKNNSDLKSNYVHVEGTPNPPSVLSTACSNCASLVSEIREVLDMDHRKLDDACCKVWSH